MHPPSAPEPAGLPVGIGSGVDTSTDAASFDPRRLLATLAIGGTVTSATALAGLLCWLTISKGNSLVPVLLIIAGTFVAALKVVRAAWRFGFEPVAKDDEATRLLRAVGGDASLLRVPSPQEHVGVETP